MAVSLSRNIKAFVSSAITVGARSVIALGAFVLIARNVAPQELATYGVVGFIWLMIYTTSQNIASQPLMDLNRVRRVDIASARFLSTSIAALLSLLAVALTPVLLKLYPDLINLKRSLLWMIILGPLSVMGSVDFSLAQRQMRFSFIAKTQTAAVIIACLLSGLIAQWDPVIGLIGIQALVGPVFAIIASRGRRWRLIFPQLSSVKRLLKVGRHLAFEGNLANVAIQGPVILFGLILSADDLALLVLISRFVQLIASQLGRISTLVILPMIKREAKDKIRLHQTIMSTSFLSNGLVALPLIIMFSMPSFTLTILNAPHTTQAIPVFYFLVLKQILDTSGNTVFSTFRAIGRPDAGWIWSLIFCTIWIAIAGFGFYFDFDILDFAIFMAVTGVLSLIAVYWLCKVAGLPFRAYLNHVGPIYTITVLALIVSYVTNIASFGVGVQAIYNEFISCAFSVLIYISSVWIYIKKRNVFSFGR